MFGPLKDQLERARLVAHMTQDELAAKIGVGRGQVSHTEKGSRSTPIDRAEAWAEACGYEIMLVPKGDADPEGLSGMVRALEDPAARHFVATAARLTRRPHRYWMRLLEDFRFADAKAARDESEDAAFRASRD